MAVTITHFNLLYLIPQQPGVKDGMNWVQVKYDGQGQLGINSTSMWLLKAIETKKGLGFLIHRKVFRDVRKELGIPVEAEERKSD